MTSQLQLTAPYSVNGTPKSISYELRMVPTRLSRFHALVGWITPAGHFKALSELLNQPKPGVVLGLDMDGTSVQALTDLSTERHFNKHAQNWCSRER
jgi:hypothetical protein